MHIAGKNAAVTQSSITKDWPEDPVAALRKIAEFLDENMDLKGHRYPDDADKRSFTGYWQSVSFFYGLQAIQHYARSYQSSSS